MPQGPTSLLIPHLIKHGMLPSMPFGFIKSLKRITALYPGQHLLIQKLLMSVLSEAEAKEKKLDIEISQYSIEELDRAIADGEAKVYKSNYTKGSDKILGVTIISSMRRTFSRICSCYETWSH